MRDFIAHMVELLAVDKLNVSETAKQALGAELHLDVVPLIFEHLNM